MTCSTLSLVYNLFHIKLWKDCIKVCIATYCSRFVFWFNTLKLSVKGKNSLCPKNKAKQNELLQGLLQEQAKWMLGLRSLKVLLSHCFTPTFSCLVTVCSFDYLTWLTVANLTDYNCQWVRGAGSGTFFWRKQTFDSAIKLFPVFPTLPPPTSIHHL